MLLKFVTEQVKGLKFSIFITLQKFTGVEKLTVFHSSVKIIQKFIKKCDDFPCVKSAMLKANNAKIDC
jgi:hypothetical protein